MKVIIFGATGSIGQSALRVIREQRKQETIQITAITGNNNVEQLSRDAIEFNVERVVTANHEHLFQLRNNLAPYEIEVSSGSEAILETAQMEADWILSAIIGYNGVPPTLEAIRNCKTVAIANKESLVCAGKIIMDMAEKCNTTILPVDSEHNAIFQCLNGESIKTVRKVILTASGGPFRNWTLEEMKKATLEEALAHPTWNMGKRISIDSATMFNKALELIEAKYFFQLKTDQLDIIIHPESIVHSMVNFYDNSTIAQLGPHDMKHAIAYTLNYPNRKEASLDEIDFAAHGKLTFEVPDLNRFPALRLAQVVLESEGGLGTAFNAAKEVALDRFMSGEIGFLDMSRLVEAVLILPELISLEHKSPESLDEVSEINDLVRRVAKETRL